MAAYANRLHWLLETKWQNATMAEIINATILCQLSPRDQRIEQIAVGKDIETKDQFLHGMKAVALARRPASSSDTLMGPEAKRHKPSVGRYRCFYCGIPGHKIAQCRKRINFERQTNIRSPTSSRALYFKSHEEAQVSFHLRHRDI